MWCPSQLEVLEHAFDDLLVQLDWEIRENGHARSVCQC